MQGQVQHALGDSKGGVCRREGGREKMESMEGGSWKQELLIDGLWLAYIIHYLGWAPELVCVWAERPDNLSVIVKGPSQNRFVKGSRQHQSL